MKILSTNVYVGPSVFAHFRVIRHVIDLGVLKAYFFNPPGPSATGCN